MLLIGIILGTILGLVGALAWCVKLLFDVWRDS